MNDLTATVTHRNGKVRVEFSESITGFEVDPQRALEIAQDLATMAQAAARQVERKYD